MIGIYKIVNVVNGKVYVGSSVNVEKRWREHKNSLKINKHHSIHLQFSWNKHGENNFQFELVEGVMTLDKEYILEREQYWLDYHKSYKEDKGYNICEVVGNTLGREHSEETKQKLSETIKGENHPLFGKHHSEETKQKMSEAKKGKYVGENNPNYGNTKLRDENGSNSKLTWIIVQEIREKYIPFKYGLEKLAKEYDVCKSTIHYILNNKSWKE